MIHAGVCNDRANAAAAVKTQKNEGYFARMWEAITMAALLLSVVAIGMQLRKNV
jgi:hypothetical protein